MRDKRTQIGLIFAAVVIAVVGSWFVVNSSKSDSPGTSDVATRIKGQMNTGTTPSHDVTGTLTYSDTPNSYCQLGWGKQLVLGTHTSVELHPVQVKTVDSSTPGTCVATFVAHGVSGQPPLRVFDAGKQVDCSTGSTEALNCKESS